MRLALILPVAAIAAILAWILGSPALGQSSVQPTAEIAHPTAISAPAGGALTAPPPQATPIIGQRPQPLLTHAEHRRASSPKHPTASSRHVTSPTGTTIIIPRLGIRVPVLDRGVDAAGHLPIADGLAVTHYTFSAPAGERGNYVAYGHDDIQGSVFEYLGNLQVGDPIELVGGGKRYLYRVTRSRVVWPTDVSVLRPTAGATMTLITCTPYMVDTQRIIVNAALAGVEGISSPFGVGASP